AEAMAFAASSLVAGQAVALAVSGRLAEAYGPAGAFAVAVGAAALSLTLALVTRVPAARTPVKPFIPAQQTAAQQAAAQQAPTSPYAGR
ncbi:MFS transporter, partial [Streptomyces sp. NPDC048551]